MDAALEKVALAILITVCGSGCVSHPDYPATWPAVDSGRTDLTGRYREVGFSNYRGVLSSVPLTAALLGSPALSSPELSDSVVELVDHGERLEIIIWKGDREVVRTQLEKNRRQNEVYGLLNDFTTWKAEEAGLTKAESAFALTFIVNGYSSDDSCFHRAVDGGLVLEGKRQIYAFIVYFPLWIEHSSYWTRWEPVPESETVSAR